MNLYYVFDDEQTALGAEAYITQVGGAPIVGRNFATGQPEPDKTKTERWAIPQQRVTDGKWVFPIVPQEIAEQYPPEVSAAFNTNYPNVKEEFDPLWFPEEDEE